MASNWNSTDFDRLLADRNYVGAHEYLRNAHLEEPKYSEYCGQIAGAVVTELGRTNKREDAERQVYLRAILAWVLKDVPGLASLYREQVRVAQGGGDPVSGMYRGIRNINDVASGRKSVSEGVEEAVEQLRDFADRASEEVRDRYRDFVGRSGGGRSGEQGPESGDGGGRDRDVVNQFLESAERGLTEGLRQLGNFFESARRTAEEESHGDPKPNRGQDDSSTSFSAESEDGASIRVDIVDESDSDAEQDAAGEDSADTRDDAGKGGTGRKRRSGGSSGAEGRG